MQFTLREIDLAKFTEEQQRFSQLLLETLSLYESYSLERLIIEMDQDFVENHEKLTLEDLEFVLKRLKKQGLIQVSKNDQNEKLYQRRFPQKSLWKRIKLWWAGL